MSSNMEVPNQVNSGASPTAVPVGANTVQQVSGGVQNTAAALYIGDLHVDVQESHIFDIFNAVGPVASIRICRDSVTRRSLGYGYINYHNAADAERAMAALNYSSIKNQPCRLMWASNDSTVRKTESGNVFVKNLDPSIDNKSLYDTFSLFGNILSCKVAVDECQRSKGYGFVHYEREEDAKDAIGRINGMLIGNKKVFVGPFQKKEEREAVAPVFSANLYVRHFPASWEEDDLRKLFEPFGTIKSVFLMTDSLSRKFGFVNFEQGEEAEKAEAALHGKDMRPEESRESPEPAAVPGEELPAHRLYVVKAQTKKERHALLSGRFESGTDAGVNLYVKNLDESITDEKMKELFEVFGTVISTKIMKDSNGKSRGFGFVGFENSEAATAAVADMHLKKVNDRPIYVGLAERKDVRAERMASQFKGNFKGGKGGYGGKNSYPMRPQQGMYYSQQMPMMPQMSPVMYRGQGFGMAPRPMTYIQNQVMMPNMRPAQGRMPQPYNFTANARNPQVPVMPNVPQGGEKKEMTSFDPNQPLTAAALASAPPGMQKQMLGEKLFPIVAKYQGEMAGKITGMMLEMDNSEILMLLESETQMKAKVDEAMRVLEKQS